MYFVTQHFAAQQIKNPIHKHKMLELATLSLEQQLFHIHDTNTYLLVFTKIFYLYTLQTIQ